MNEFSKVVRLGQIERIGSVFCKIECKDGRLSITGVEGPMRNGDARGSCGQIDTHLRANQETIACAPGWDSATLARFFDVWDRYHLNDMKAGSAVQEAYLRANPIPAEECAYPKSYYEVACAKLRAAKLNPDPDGYNYGTAWKREEVPADVLEFLASLPDADIQPAWV